MSGKSPDEAGDEDSILLLDFHADWCGPCTRQHEIVDDLEASLDEAYGDDSPLNVIQIDVEQDEAVAEAYGVRSLPTLVLKHGEVGDADEGVIREFVGVTSEADLRDAFDEAYTR